MKKQKRLYEFLADFHSSTLPQPEFTSTLRRKQHLPDSLKRASALGHCCNALLGFGGLVWKIKPGRTKLPLKGRGDLGHSPG